MDLVVEHNDRQIIINKKLLDSQKAWDKLPVIKALHKSMMVVKEIMRDTDDIVCLRSFDKWLTELEYMLQDAWGFERDSKFHRFWDRPKCGCPKMDNDDRWPTGYYVINKSCILHGSD